MKQMRSVSGPRYNKSMEKILEVLSRHGISFNDFDLLVIGDGAGQHYGRHASWAMVMLDKNSARSRILSGAWSDSTITRAEVEPLLHALTIDLYEDHSGVLLNQRRVVVITDSGAATGMFNMCWGLGVQLKDVNGNLIQEPPCRRINGDLVARMRHFRDCGYVVTPVQIRRSDLPTHQLIDALSRSGRFLEQELIGKDPYVILELSGPSTTVPILQEPFNEVGAEDRLRTRPKPKRTYGNKSRRRKK